MIFGDFHQCYRYERVNVIGTSGSGKSTFSRALAGILHIPHHEMDSLFWKPDWRESTDDALLKKVRNVTLADKWILDGNYTRTIPEKWKRVQLVIWLDLSFPRTILRVTKRAIHRSLTRKELWPGTGNRETLSKAFLSKESIIWWAMTTHGKNRKKYGEIVVSPEYSHIHFVRLTSPRMVAGYLEAMRTAAEDPTR